MARHGDDEDLKVARGTDSTDRKGNQVAFTPMEKMRKTPVGLLSIRAKREWTRVVRGLIEDGMVAEADRSLLIAYCNETAKYHRLSEDVEAAELAKTPFKDIEARADRALKNAMKLGEMFGLTVTGRSKIKPQKAKQKADPQSTGEQFNNLMKTG